MAWTDFFTRFRRRQEPLDDWMARRAERVARALSAEEAAASAANCPSSQRLRNYLSTLFTMSVDDRGTLVSALRARRGSSRPRESQLAGWFTEVIKTGIEQGEFATAASARQVGQILCDLYLGAQRRWCDLPDGNDETFAADLAAALIVVLHGIGDPSAISSRTQR